MATESRGEMLSEAVVRELAAEAAETGAPRKDDATEVVEQFANLANATTEFVVDSLTRTVAARPIVSLAAAAGAGFLFGQWSRWGYR